MHYCTRHFIRVLGIELRSQDKHLTLLTESSLQLWFGPFFFFFLLFGMGVCAFVSADTFVWMQIHKGRREQPRGCQFLLSTLLETGSLYCFTDVYTRLAGQWASGESPVSTSCLHIGRYHYRCLWPCVYLHMGSSGLDGKRFTHWGSPQTLSEAFESSQS